MMYQKKIIKSLEKCYCVAELEVDGERCLLTAGEKIAPCYLFTRSGEWIDTVWEGPGGVMTMVQLPGRPGEFLATHRFYSPNDSAEASIVYVRRQQGKWQAETLYSLPFVHRFDIIESGGAAHLIACTLKSGHEYKNDWTHPGKVFTAVLPDPEKPFDRETVPPLREIRGGFTHNHGMTRCCSADGIASEIISCDSGVFRFFPPVNREGEWRVQQLLDTAVSDALCVDLDGDGVDELFTLSPFHGDSVQLYKLLPGEAILCWSLPEKMPFLHAICRGTIGGQESIVFGNREGERRLMRLWYDGGYHTEEIDRGYGPANALIFRRDGEDVILAANRETDQIAMYTRRDP